MLKVLSSFHQRVVISVGGIERTALVYKPLSGGGSLPPVVLFHGAGGTAEWALQETRFTELADRKDVSVILPEGLARNPHRPPKFLTNPQEWNDGSGRGSADDVAFLNELLDYLQIDRVNLTGFSNGAGMAFRYAAEQSERVIALAAVAGHCHMTTHIVRPMPSWYIVGTADPIIPLSGGSARTPWGLVHDRPSVLQTVRRWAEMLGCHSLPEILTDWSCGLFKVTLLHGQGHHWPAGEGRMGEKLGGPHLSHFDASREIIQFFQQVYQSTS
ncbi:MAG: alpha/beta fold hydrolase [Gemmataceae bacterium]|jgi:polyhydroxybutyrate depolymerase|nr:alpha/beta fold hydrolase [Gemmataceae bacterium]